MCLGDMSNTMSLNEFEHYDRSLTRDTSAKRRGAPSQFDRMSLSPHPGKYASIYLNATTSHNSSSKLQRFCKGTKQLFKTPCAQARSSEQAKKQHESAIRTQPVYNRTTPLEAPRRATKHPQQSRTHRREGAAHPRRLGREKKRQKYRPFGSH